MSVAFVRQLGSESGIQLNPLRDDSNIPTPGRSDQRFAMILRSPRGRIDRPFIVNRHNARSLLGRPELIKQSALNLAAIHVLEALDNGAYEVIVQRVSTAQAQRKWLIAELGRDPASKALTGTVNWRVAATLPSTPYLLAIDHLQCHNDGLCAAIHAAEKHDGGLAVANDYIRLRVSDADGQMLFEFSGSLNENAKDDDGRSAFLPDVVQAQTDALTVVMGGSDKAIEPTCEAWGWGHDGQPRWADSGLHCCFEEGPLTFSADDWRAARIKLQNSPHDYAYIASGGSQSPILLHELAQLAWESNRQLRFDVEGTLPVAAAIAFVQQLNLSSHKAAHLIHAFWSPIYSDDPARINPKGHFGVATLNIAYACGRNATTDANGFAPKNWPIAGKNWPIARSGMMQTQSPTSQELSQLAQAKINPVLYQTYGSGGQYVFRDSLTLAPVDNSLKKLIAVVDMSTHLDEAVTRAGNELLQLPMDVAIRRMRDFLNDLFDRADTAGWLTPSFDPAMNGRSFNFEVQADPTRPHDTLQVRYWLHFDGTLRQLFVTQTLTR